MSFRREHTGAPFLSRRQKSSEVIETSCCGSAGSFGLEVERYDASMQMGELT